MAAHSAAVRYLSNNAGVTMFTRLSVHCADKMQPIVNSSGLRKYNSQCASGYVFFNTCSIFAARSTRAVLLSLGMTQLYTKRVEALDFNAFQAYSMKRVGRLGSSRRPCVTRLRFLRPVPPWRPGDSSGYVHYLRRSGISPRFRRRHCKYPWFV